MKFRAFLRSSPLFCGLRCKNLEGRKEGRKSGDELSDYFMHWCSKRRRKREETASEGEGKTHINENGGDVVAGWLAVIILQNVVEAAESKPRLRYYPVITAHSVLPLLRPVASDLG
jgi:hypothetical protein